MDLGLEGKRVLVTGAGQGIGREIGEMFAREGANVAFHYHSSSGGAVEAVAAARALGVGAMAVQGDLSIAEDVERVVTQVEAELGTVEILINNAAFTSTGPFLEDDSKGWRKQVDVTVLGMLEVSQRVLPAMVEARDGSIVTIAGDSGRVGESRAVATATCRASAYGFTMSVAKEFGRNGVRANCVSLGLVRSPSVDNHFLGDASEEFLQRVVKAYPLRRLGEMNDVAPAVVFLASSASSWTTGQVLSVNGGYATG